MKKLLFVGVAVSLLSAASAVLAADMSVKAPRIPVVAPFTWTSCFLGAHAGGGWTRNDITDPVRLVQDTILLAPVTTGVTTANISSSGAVIGGQFGCDYQFAPNWVVGGEGSIAGSTMRDSTRVGLPLSPGDSALVTARTEFLSSITARFGYAVDRWLYYVRGGAAWAGDKYNVAGVFQGNNFTFDGSEWRPGWSVGAGIEWAFADNWSARLEYDYYGLGTRTISMTDNVNGFGPGPLDVKQSVQTVKLGINFHVWGRP